MIISRLPSLIVAVETNVIDPSLRYNLPIVVVSIIQQGDSEKIRFPLSSDERDGLSAITLNQFNGSGG